MVLSRAVGSRFAPDGVVGPEAIFEAVGRCVPASQEPAAAAIAVIPPLLLAALSVATDVEVVGQRLQRGGHVRTSIGLASVGELNELAGPAVGTRYEQAQRSRKATATRSASPTVASMRWVC